MATHLRNFSRRQTSGKMNPINGSKIITSMVKDLYLTTSPEYTKRVIVIFTVYSILQFIVFCGL